MSAADTLSAKKPRTARVTVLGSGTSTGVPVIGCGCAVCRSPDPRDRRLRPGLKIELSEGAILVDAPTDLREQLLRFGLERLDAVLFTHAHADHVFGLDDLRIFNFRQRSEIPCYGSPETLRALRRTFAYAFEEGQEGGGKPRLDLRPIDPLGEAIEVCGTRILPIPVFHGDLPVLGFRLADFAYVTDVNQIPAASRELLRDLDVLILGALRYRPHPTHFSIAEALAMVAELRPRRALLTHLAHDVLHAAPELPLPPGVEFAFDGITFDVE
jgi:phosphoribosyl 1,2-cyclic phosphate phosphodiesterase